MSGRVCPRCMGRGYDIKEPLRERIVGAVFYGSIMLVVIPLTWLHYAGRYYFYRMGWMRPW